MKELCRERILLEHAITHKKLRGYVRSKLKLNISLRTAGRVKREVKEKVNGGFKAEYGKLHDYALELKHVDDHTTIQVLVDDKNPEKISYFKAFYVCFAACKEGWKDG